MPPRTKKRKVKESEEEVIFNEKLNEAFYKYRHESDIEVDEEDEDVGMFEVEEAEPRILIENIERVCETVGVEWDEAVLAILDQEQRTLGLVAFETVKLIIATLKVNIHCIIWSIHLYFIIYTLDSGEAEG